MPPSPLERRNLGPLLQLVIPTFPVATGILGLSYALTPGARWLQSPVFSIASDILPMPVWGAAFLALTAQLVWALATAHRGRYERGLAVLTAVLIIWAAVFAWTAIDGDGSPSAWVWPTFAAVVAVGTIRELTTPRERL